MCGGPCPEPDPPLLPFLISLLRYSPQTLLLFSQIIFLEELTLSSHRSPLTNTLLVSSFVNYKSFYYIP
jgi:hypothetical protein